MKKIAITLLVIGLISVLFATEMIIHKTNGTQESFQINEIESITFGSDNTIVVQPDSTEGMDVWITNIYYGGGQDDEKLRIGGWADWYYGLIKFDIEELPSNVESATIQLYSFYDGHTYRTDMHLDRITSYWDEDTLWDDRPTYIDNSYLQAPTLDCWYEVDITELYNNWKNGVYTNYGIQFRPVSNSDALNAFYSSDYTDDSSLRPKLIIIP